LAAGLFLTPSFWLFAGLALWLFTLNGRAITQESQRLQVIKEELKTPRPDCGPSRVSTIPIPNLVACDCRPQTVGPQLHAPVFSYNPP
jgi:hypothetical protein